MPDYTEILEGFNDILTRYGKIFVYDLNGTIDGTMRTGSMTTLSTAGLNGTANLDLNEPQNCKIKFKKGDWSTLPKINAQLNISGSTTKYSIESVKHIPDNPVFSVFVRIK